MNGQQAVCNTPTWIHPHPPTDSPTGKTQGCAPSVPQASYTIVVPDTKSVSPDRWHGRGPTDTTEGTSDMSQPNPPAAPSPNAAYEPGINVTMFGLPASFEDMEYLGLDPETGDPVEDD